VQGVQGPIRVGLGDVYAMVCQILRESLPLSFGLCTAAPETRVALSESFGQRACVHVAAVHGMDPEMLR
jgi:hypothetical protein